jgi:hypothetical protein
MTEELSRWTAKFIFHNKSLTELDLINSINNIQFVREPLQLCPTDTPEVRLIGFNIVIPKATEQNARSEAEKKANIIFNYLTCVHDYAIRGHLSNMTNDKGECNTASKFHSFTHKSLNIDLADINKLIESSDEKKLRQLAHYSRGVEATDIITKYREFYQVFEEDIDESTPPKKERNKAKDIDVHSRDDLENYEILLFIRNLVNHPSLKYPKSKAIALKLMVKPSLNLNNPEELELVKSYLKIMQKEAKDIIEKFARGR